MVISQNLNSRNSEKPRNSKEKRMPPIFPLMREFTVIRHTDGFFGLTQADSEANSADFVEPTKNFEIFQSRN